MGNLEVFGFDKLCTGRNALPFDPQPTLVRHDPNARGGILRSIKRTRMEFGATQYSAKTAVGKTTICLEQ